MKLFQKRTLGYSEKEMNGVTYKDLGKRARNEKLKGYGNGALALISGATTLTGAAAVGLLLMGSTVSIIAPIGAGAMACYATYMAAKYTARAINNFTGSKQLRHEKGRREGYAQAEKDAGINISKAPPGYLPKI
jgi:hypothetical protein